MEHALVLFHLFLFLTSTQIYPDQTEVIYAYVSNRDNLQIYKGHVITW